MAKIIDDETMENVCILAKLSLSEEEKEKALTLLMNHYHPESVKFNPKFVHIHSRRITSARNLRSAHRKQCPYAV